MLSHSLPRHFVRLFAIAAALTSLTGCANTPTTTSQANGSCAPDTASSPLRTSASDLTISRQTEAALANRIIELTNQQRRNAGLRPYRLNCAELLQSVAIGHSASMARHNMFGHVDRYGRKPLDRVVAADPTFTGLVAENVALIGFEYRGSFLTRRRNALAGVRVEKLAHDFVGNWMKSPGHKKNILRPDVTQIGVGVAIDANTIYVTQLFARPSR
ncbi:MAG: CAP domain-containing protein [Alphaproteobacteria bacterium]|nr:MAG: CAP domain-containing protein [Alphaproteobacteria bacterium]